MNKKLCNFRFDVNFIRTLEQLAYLEATNKTEIIKRAVFEYSDANIGRLEERYEKMNLSSSSEDQVGAVELKVSFRDSIFSSSSRCRELSDVIADISSGVHKALIEQIRIEDKETRNQLKKKLSVFYVDVFFEDSASSLSKSSCYKSTGIIQFDIDDYDVEKSKSIVKTINDCSSVIYSFLSASGGIKFGVRTDFKCSDSTIKHKHEYAYEIVKEELSELLETLEVDDAVGSVSQQCYLSYDENAYLNLDAEKIILNDRVNSTFNEEQARIDDKARKNAESLATNKTNEKDVLDALSCINKSMSYEERLQINFVVIDFFGDGAKSILLNHWNKTDKKKLASQIDSQIRAHKSGREFKG